MAGLTVEQLAAIPALRSRVIAGATGATARIGWAHVCELADPWEWLGDGDLVMTTGIGIPPGRDDQAAYARHCATAGMAGIAVSQDMNAPASLHGLRSACDDVGLALVSTERSVPFVAMAKAIADASQAEERRRLHQTWAVYQTALESKGPEAGSGALMDNLGEALGCRFVILEEGREAPELRSHPAGAGVSRPQLQIPIPGFPRAQLHIAVLEDELDPQTVRHVALLGAFELSQRDRVREISRRQGSYLLMHLLDGQIQPDDAKTLLRDRGFDSEPLVVAAMAADTADADLHHRLEDRGVPHALLLRSQRLLVLMPDGAGVEHLLAGRGNRVGISGPLGDLRQLRQAASEAHMALASAEQHEIQVLRFGDRPISLVPKTIHDAEALVDNTLGPLLAHDAKHATEYVRSVRVFLAHDRRWTTAARELHIHRQTMVYRMQRVTELTGKRLNNTADVAQLWAALATLDSACL